MNGAERILEFFERYLVHIDAEWAGRPFVPADWQRAYLRSIFGTLNEHGLRQYRKSLLEVPIGQGKSTFAAGIALYLLLADDEPGAQVFLAAANRIQAGIIYRLASEMVLRNEELREACDVLESTKRILYRRASAFLAVLSSDAPTAHGINAHGVIFDELHTQKDRRLYDVLSYRMRSRRQPLMLMLSTAGFDPLSVWGLEHDYAIKVRDGVIQDESYLPVIYGAGEKDDWQDPLVWKKTNPSWDAMGPTFQRGIELAAKRAHDDPSSLNAFLRQHLNLSTRQDVRWMPMEAWDRSAGIVDPESLRARIAYCGLDIANTEDLAAFALVFPPEDGDPNDEGQYQAVLRYWIPETSAQKRVRVARVPYDTWIAEGFIRPTEGDVIDYAAIRKQILEDAERFRIAQIRYDPWGASQLVQDLQGEGIECVPIQQGFRLLSAPTKELLRLVLARRLRHGGNPVLRWNADNVVVRQDPYGNLRPAKDRSREKIDGIVALVLAIDGAMRNRAEPSVYDSRGILSV